METTKAQFTQNEEICESLDQLSDLLQLEKIDNTVLENLLSKNSKLIENVKEEGDFLQCVPKIKIQLFFERVGSWIVKNFSSVKLNSVLVLISLILNKLGHTVSPKREELIKLLQLETYEQMLTNVKKDKKNYEEFLNSDSILNNSFITAFYALVATISNKPEIIIKSKNLLRSVLTVMAQICDIDNVAIFYKKKRLISNFTKILKELKKSPDTQDSLIMTSNLLMNLFAKIGLKRPIYRDYMFKKAVPDKITDIFNLFYKQDLDLVKSFSVYIFSATRTVDHKTYFWTKGVVNNILEILEQLIAEESQDENLIEYLTLSLYNLSSNNYDIQMELKDLNFLEVAKQIIMKFSKNYFIIFNTLSCLRRIKDEEYMDKITEELLYTYFALFDYFYLTIKKEIENKENNTVDLSKSGRFEFIILKELIAILGNIVKDEMHCKPFIEKNLHLVLIDIKLSFTSLPKIIKNTIGALINLTNSAEIRENICKVAAFVQSIYIVTDKYKENQAIIDYELKLIMNVIKNDITIKMFISGDIFFYLLLFIKNYTSHDEIIFNSIKILRTLILKSNLNFNSRKGIRGIYN